MRHAAPKADAGSQMCPCAIATRYAERPLVPRLKPVVASGSSSRHLAAGATISLASSLGFRLNTMRRLPPVVDEVEPRRP